jgi:type IV secretory pathway VirB10-like protein
MLGTDEAGSAGFGANVDEHLNKVFTSALLLRIIGAGARLSQPQQSSSLHAAPSVGQTIAGAGGQQIDTRASSSRSDNWKSRRPLKSRQVIFSTCLSIATSC